MKNLYSIQHRVPGFDNLSSWKRCKLSWISTLVCHVVMISVWYAWWTRVHQEYTGHWLFSSIAVECWTGVWTMGCIYPYFCHISNLFFAAWRYSTRLLARRSRVQVQPQPCLSHIRSEQETLNWRNLNHMEWLLDAGWAGTSKIMNFFFNSGKNIFYVRICHVDMTDEWNVWCTHGILAYQVRSVYLWYTCIPGTFGVLMEYLHTRYVWYTLLVLQSKVHEGFGSGTRICSTSVEWRTTYRMAYSSPNVPHSLYLKVFLRRGTHGERSSPRVHQENTNRTPTEPCYTLKQF